MTVRDISEQRMYERYPQVLTELLKDHSTNEPILWGTGDYAYLGAEYSARSHITPESITGEGAGIISPRVLKPISMRTSRTQEKAEVFTPAWLCNEQNSLVDDAWFGRRFVFNRPMRNGWRTNKGPIEFEPEGPKTWQSYVDERRLEIACGEAPYLVSRYDMTDGRSINLLRRIGILDRKMRVVNENTHEERAWKKWAERAFQSVYGFEFQGDSLLIARENLLASYRDYMRAALGRNPTHDELLRIAHIVSWNIWQMDAFTGTIPYKTAPDMNKQAELFGMGTEIAGDPCLVKDWRARKTVPFITLLGGRSLES